VVLLTKNLAIDYGPSGIRANAICPGFVDTPMTAGIFDGPELGAVGAAMRDEHALRRYARPDEIASVASFLLSTDASFVSGAAMPVDGRLHRRPGPTASPSCSASACTDPHRSMGASGA